MKSNQWDEVITTAEKLRKLQRVFRAPGRTLYGDPKPQIPIFAVGYKGWKSLDIVKEKANSGVVDGILVIDSGLFSTSAQYLNGFRVEGPYSLLGLVSALHVANTAILSNSFNPLEYAIPLNS